MRITYYLLILYTKISLKLSVVSPPSFAKEPQDTWFINLSSSDLYCNASQYPTAVSYQWMHEKEILQNFTNFTHIQVKNYGAYTCLLSNSFGTVRSRTALVQKPVINHQKMADVHKNILNGAYLFLPSPKVYESIPPIEEIFWQKKTESQDWIDIFQKDYYTKNSSLLIRKVSKEHNASFRCSIKQKSGDSLVVYTVTVNITETVPDKTQCDNNSVALLEVPAHVTVYAGQDISIECLSFFYRCSFPPAFNWYHNYLINKTLISNKAILNILNSQLSDSGIYSCEVRGWSYRPQTLVTVLVKPELNISTSESATFYINNDDPITIDIVVLTSSVGLKRFEWYFNGKNLSGNSKYNYTADHKLIVNQPVESDSGFYQVFYFFDGLELKHAFNALFINIYSKIPSFAEEPKDTWFKKSSLKSSSNLYCIANKHPMTLSYQWMYETEIVSEYTNFNHIQVNKYGAYTCLLSNSFGTVRSRTALVQAPVIQFQKMDDIQKNILNGGYLFLPSLKVYESIPPVEEVFWQKKSQDWIDIQKDYYTKNSSLLIRRVSEEHNTSFRYIIKQTSDRLIVGYAVTVNITATVPDRSQCDNISVALLEVPTHVTVYAGQDISIECLAFFYHCSFSPAFNWYHNYPINKMKISNKSILNILNSQPSDSGIYSCEVRGWSYRPQTLVTVLVKPMLNTSPSESAILYIKDGAPITLDMVTLTSSVGLKSYEWYFNGKSLSGNSKYNYTADHKLIVNQPIESDSGIYQVFYFFDGFELKHAFNAFFANNKSIMVTNSLTSMSMSSRVSTINSKSISTEDVKVTSFSLSSTFSSFSLSSTFLSTYIPLHQSILSFSQHPLPSLLSSSFESSCLVSLSALSCQPEATSSTFVVEKKQIKNNALVIGLSTGSAALIICMLIGLVMRKRFFVKKNIKKEIVEEVAMCEIKTKETTEAEYDYVTIPKSHSLDELLTNTPNSEYKCQENPYYG